MDGSKRSMTQETKLDSNTILLSTNPEVRHVHPNTGLFVFGVRSLSTNISKKEKNNSFYKTLG